MRLILINLIALISRFAPSWISVWIASKTRTPRRFPGQPWEKTRAQLRWEGFITPTVYAYRYGSSNSLVVLAHGWEGRASQWSILIDELVDVGAAVLALDMPAHGRSVGRRADPEIFSKALREILGSVPGIDMLIGHSMGGAAVADALAESETNVPAAIICTPFSMRDVLERAAQSIGLSAKATRMYVRAMETRVGRPVDSLSFDELSSRLTGKVLVIHDSEDKEVPLDAGVRIRRAVNGARLHITNGLGHRRILKDTATAKLIADFYLQTNVMSHGSESLREAINER